MNYLFIDRKFCSFNCDFSRNSIYCDTIWYNNYFIRNYHDIIAANEQRMIWVCCENIHDKRGVYSIDYNDVQSPSIGMFYEHRGKYYDNHFRWSFEKNPENILSDINYTFEDIHGIWIRCPQILKFQKLVFAANKFCSRHTSTAWTYSDILPFIS